MAKLTLNVGSANNDKTGDTLRAGGLKIKANFDDIYAALASDGVNISGGNVLKTGNYQDLSNKPVFATVATTGDFYDLTDRPDIGIFVGEPPNDEGSEGHVAGNLAFNGTHLYVCREDYVQQDDFSGFSFISSGNTVKYSLVAFTSGTGASITFNQLAGAYAPQVGWEVTDGTVTRTITAVSTSSAPVKYTCTLDGAFTSVATNSYRIQYNVPSGQFVVTVGWNSVTYQSLVDQHNGEGKTAKLYIDADGYGRVVEDVIVDTFEEELQFVYTAGSEVGDYAGLNFVLDQPKIWKSIPFAPTYNGSFSGGSASTGDITYDGVKIIGSGTASGDGAGYATLELVPDNSLYSNGQYLVIDPTAPSHIHIRAGGLQDQSPADLFLGGEKHYVRVRDNQGVRLQNEQITEQFWFYSDPTNFNTGTWFEENGSYYIQFTTTNQEMISKFWEFTNGGQNRVVINENDTVEYGGWASNPSGDIYKVQVLTAPPTSPTNLTSLEFQLFVTNTNYINLENNDFRVDVQDDIRMFGRDIFRLANYSFEEPIEIQTDYDNQAWTWRFNPDGILDLPDGKALNFRQGIIGAPEAGGGTDRVRLYDFFGGGSNFNYAIGVEGNHIWFSMDVNNGTGGYKFYSRDNQIFKIRDDGVLIFEDGTTFNVSAAPTTSKGQVGDKAGTVAFDATYMYYCKQNYAASSISVTALASASTTVWIDSADYAGDLVADFTANSTGWTYNGVTITAVSADNTFGPGYALTGTTGFSVVNGNNYTLVSPNLPDIWKRVAWSNDTW